MRWSACADVQAGLRFCCWQWRKVRVSPVYAHMMLNPLLLGFRLATGLLFLCWVMFHAFLVGWLTLNKTIFLFFFLNIISETLSECNNLWSRSVLILVQNVCNGYQQLSNVAASKERLKLNVCVQFSLVSFEISMLTIIRLFVLLHFVFYSLKWMRIYCEKKC